MLRMTAIAVILMSPGASACQSAAEACISAGGRCLIGVTPCTKRGDTCNTNPPNPGGAFCSFDQVDAGLDTGGGADAARDAAGVCTPGQDSTCNDNPAVSSIYGTCLADGSCSCSAGFALNLVTGKCR